ncbi:MAG: hypothetical protein J0L93_03055 [Deltaproteobacteria bacterium]|nr:hypothetical protein [Deltaproteobacteria bacterium]
MQMIKVLVLGVVSSLFLFASEAHAGFSISGFCKTVTGSIPGFGSKRSKISAEQAIIEIDSLKNNAADLGSLLRAKWKGEDFKQLSKTNTPLQTCRDNKKDLDTLLEKLELVSSRLTLLAQASVSPKTADQIANYVFSQLLLDGNFIYALKFFKKVEAGLKIYRAPGSTEHLDGETVAKIQSVNLEKWDEIFRALFKKIGPQLHINITELINTNSNASFNLLSKAISDLSAKQPNLDVGKRSPYTLRTAVETSEFDKDARTLIDTRRAVVSEFLKYRELSPFMKSDNSDGGATAPSTNYQRPKPKVEVPDAPIELSSKKSEGTPIFEKPSDGSQAEGSK